MRGDVFNRPERDHDKCDCGVGGVKSLRRSRDKLGDRGPLRGSGVRIYVAFMSNEFNEHYRVLSTGSYDWVDRNVLNAYFSLGDSAGWFRTWWRRWHRDSDEELDNTHLIGMAARFSRRVRGWANAHRYRVSVPFPSLPQMNLPVSWSETRVR